MLLLVLHDSLVRCAGYDARVRVMMRRLANLLDIRWEWSDTHTHTHTHTHTQPHSEWGV